jgi:integrase/recombinase XerD
VSHSIFVARTDCSPFYMVRGLPAGLSKNIESFFELYLARGFSRRTIRAYAFDLVIFFRFFQSKRANVPEFKKVDFKTLIAFIHQEKGRNAAPASINRRLNTIDILYRHCFNKLIPGTQAPNIDPGSKYFRRRRYLTMDANLGIHPIYAKASRTFRVRIPNKLVKTLEPHEVKAFFETIKTHRDRAIITLMLLSGLRCIEILQLRLIDIDSLAQTLRIRGKGNKERMVPLAPGVYELLQKYIDCERPMHPKNADEESLFLTQKGPRRGMAMTIEGLRSAFRYKRAASVNHANPHRFRHTFGRNMAASGMSLRALQLLLGHADSRTTVKYINLVLQDVHSDFIKANTILKSQYGQSVY